MADRHVSSVGDDVEYSAPHAEGESSKQDAFTDAAEDADDLEFVNDRIQSVKKGRSRIVSGQELQDRLNRLLA